MLTKKISPWLESENKMSSICFSSEDLLSLSLTAGEVRMSLAILPRELLEMIVFHLDVSSTIALANCSSDLFNIVIRPINWNILMQKMFPEEEIGEDLEHFGRSVTEVVNFLDKNKLIAQLLKLMERIILR